MRENWKYAYLLLATLVLLSGGCALETNKDGRGEAELVGTQAATSYTVAEHSRVSLGIYDADGRLLRTLRRSEPTEPATYEVEWDGLDQHGRAVEPGNYEWRMLSYTGNWPQSCSNLTITARIGRTFI